MAYSDARNERDRAETGRNSTNHGGGDARAAAERNKNAMAQGRPRNAPYAGMPGYQPRRTQNVTPSYEMSLHNMMELSKMMPGPGLVARGAMALAGYGPDFQGPQGAVNGPGDYDPTNRFGTGLLTRMAQRAGRGRGLQYKGF